MERPRFSQDGMTVIDLGGGQSTYTGELKSRTKSTGSTIHPFLPSKGIVRSLLKTRRGRQVILLFLFNVLCTCLLLVWCHTSNSMALTAFTYLTVFDLLSLLTTLVSVWVGVERANPSVYSFGYDRFEVLAVFSSTMLAQLGSFFIIKESVERIMDQTDVHTGRLLPGMALALFIHLLVTYSVDNIALQHIISTSRSSWLQEQLADISESLCHVLPGLGRFLLPRINPLGLLGWVSALILIFVHLAVDLKGYDMADTLAAFAMALLTFVTLLPMSALSGRVLLQTSPAHISGALDKCLREASTLDGVLEFRSEHFWVVSFGKLAGSVHVRVRRDANEQLVLAHVRTRLASLVPLITVQIYKDDWASRASSYKFSSGSPSGSPVLLPPTASRPGAPTPLTDTSAGRSAFTSAPSKGALTPTQKGLQALQAAAADVAHARAGSPSEFHQSDHRSYLPLTPQVAGASRHVAPYQQAWPRTSTPMIADHFASPVLPHLQESGEEDDRQHV